jgi:ketosteroid isomerase-like protein
VVARNPADVDHLFAERLSAGDLDGALAMYEDGAIYIDGDGTESRGHAEIRATLAELIAMQGTLDCYEVDVAENGDLAVLRARWVFTGIYADGTTFESRGRSIEVVRRQPDGSWRFTIDLPNGAT